MDSSGRVLIVEDNYLLLDLLTRACERSGCTVAAASSGEAALMVIRELGATIAWLCTDIDLPGLVDGWSVADTFRALHPDRPVVYMSGAVHSRQRAVSTSLFVSKPFQLRPFADLASSLAAGAYPRAAADLRAAG